MSRARRCGHAVVDRVTWTRWHFMLEFRGADYVAQDLPGGRVAVWLLGRYSRNVPPVPAGVELKVMTEKAGAKLAYALRDQHPDARRYGCDAREVAAGWNV